MKLFGKVYLKEPFINDNLVIDYRLTETEEVEFIDSNLKKEKLTESDEEIIYNGKIISVIPNMYNFNENERVFVTNEPLIIKEVAVSEDLKKQLKIALKIII